MFKMEIIDSLKGPAEIVKRIRADPRVIDRIHEELNVHRRNIVPLHLKEDYTLAVYQEGCSLVVARYFPEEGVLELVM